MHHETPHDVMAVVPTQQQLDDFAHEHWEVRMWACKREKDVGPWGVPRCRAMHACLRISSV